MKFSHVFEHYSCLLRHFNRLGLLGYAKEHAPSEMRIELPDLPC